MTYFVGLDVSVQETAVAAIGEHMTQPWETIANSGARLLFGNCAPSDSSIFAGTCNSRHCPVASDALFFGSALAGSPGISSVNALKMSD